MRQRQTGSIWVLLSVVAIVIAILHVTGIIKPMLHVAQHSFETIQETFYRRTVFSGNEQYAQYSREMLVEQIITQQNSIASLEQRLVQQELLAQEHAELAETFEFTSRFDRIDSYSGNIIGLGVEQDPAVVILDIGSVDAPLQEGQPVIAPSGVFVGTLIQVTEHRSVLRLITHPNAAVTVSTNHEDKPIGVVSGQFGLSTKLDLVPKNSTLSKGDILYTSGIDDHIPQGLVIGAVSTLEDQANSTFKNGLVDIRFVPGELRIVTILVERKT